jgi:hypothetical protein
MRSGARVLYIIIVALLPGSTVTAAAQSPHNQHLSFPMQNTGQKIGA